MTEAFAIKLCPCCGWNARFEEVPEGQQNSGGIYIECTNKLCRLSTNLMFPLMDDVRPELAQKWNRRVPVTVSEKGEAEALLKKLVDRLHAVHADPLYHSVWALHQIRNGTYTGPQYAKEVAECDAYLSRKEQ